MVINFPLQTLTKKASFLKRIFALHIYMAIIV